MIEVDNLYKYLGGEEILKGITTRIGSGGICGLIGSNGAGKSTLMRCIGGVYQPEQGEVRIGGKAVYEAPSVKEELFFVADENYFSWDKTMEQMAAFYSAYYSSFDKTFFHELCETFRLESGKKLQKFSKGMKRQAAMILAFGVRPKVLLLDESFDGLDPVVRKAMRSVLCREVAERGMTVLISSHSLRELSDLCDQLVFIHEGRLLMDQRTENMESALIKVQAAFSEKFERSLFEGLNIVNYAQSGNVATLIIRGDREEAQKVIMPKNPLLLEFLPLSLEEIFVAEADALGYSFSIEGTEGEDE